MRWPRPGTPARCCRAARHRGPGRHHHRRRAGPAGRHDALTTSAIIGADVAGAKTGMQALLTAPPAECPAADPRRARPGVGGGDEGAGGGREEAARPRLRQGHRPRSRPAIAHRALFPDARELTLLWPGVTAPYGPNGTSIVSPSRRSPWAPAPRSTQAKGGTRHCPMSHWRILTASLTMSPSTFKTTRATPMS